MGKRGKAILSLILGIGCFFIIIKQADGAIIQIGGRYWFSAWDLQNFKTTIASYKVGLGGKEYIFDEYNDSVDNINTSGTGLMGLSFTINPTRKLGISGTFYSGKFDLKMKSKAEYLSQDGDAKAETEYNLTTSTTRTDFDVIILYSIYQNVNLYCGYKFINYSYDEQLTTASILYTFPQGSQQLTRDITVQKLNVKFHGPGIGFGSFSPLGSGFFAYGNGSFLPYLIGAGDIDKLVEDNKGYAYNIEIGLGVIIQAIHFIPNISYRFQRFEGFGDFSDTFSGVVLGANLAF